MNNPSSSPPLSPTRRPLWLWLVLIIVIAGVALIGWGLANNTGARPEVGDPLPTFELTLYDGYGYQGKTTVSSADFEGKVVVVNFWASWCLECTYEAADLEAIWQAYGPDDVVILGVAYLDEPNPSLNFLSRFGLTYPNGADFGSTLSDDVFYITGVPETFVFSDGGVLAATFIGPVEADQLRAVIDPMLLK